MPKMELTAATLLIKMDKLITKELEGRIKIHSVTFWTDSMIVLRYIFNETRRFVTFVANRVAVIREGSKPSHWRHVRSEANPADLASRGIKASETKKLEVWKHGPDFLWKDSKEWPQQPADLHQELPDQDEGVKKEKITINACTEKEDFWGTLFKRYSTWEKLRRVVATANKVGGVDCFAREIRGKDPPPFIARCTRSREKNCEECSESDLS